jgi:DNA-binding PadR family transcriptional regulator
MTPLQFLVLWLLLHGRKSGRGLREELGSRGAGMGRAAFSQMIRRMAAARLVRSDFVAEDVAGRSIRYCVYQATQQGLDRWRDARGFYAGLEEPPGTEGRLFDKAIQRREDQEFQDEFTRLAMAYARAKHEQNQRKRMEEAKRAPGRR